MARLQQKKEGVKAKLDHLTLTKAEMYRLDKFLRKYEKFQYSAWKTKPKMSIEEVKQELGG